MYVLHISLKSVGICISLLSLICANNIIVNAKIPKYITGCKKVPFNADIVIIENQNKNGAIYARNLNVFNNQKLIIYKLKYFIIIL